MEWRSPPPDRSFPGNGWSAGARRSLSRARPGERRFAGALAEPDPIGPESRARHRPRVDRVHHAANSARKTDHLYRQFLVERLGRPRSGHRQHAVWQLPALVCAVPEGERSGRGIELRRILERGFTEAYTKSLGWTRPSPLGNLAVLLIRQARAGRERLRRSQRFQWRPGSVEGAHYFTSRIHA